MELYHQGNLVATGANALPMQNTPAEGDDTWTVGLSLAPGTPQGETYPYIITLSPFPSVLPVVTRRVPLAFIQQGFDDNWNGRDYIRFEVEANTLIVTFDPELASYYHLSAVQHPLPVPWGIDAPNIQVKTSNLSIGSTAGGAGVLPGPLTEIILSTTFTGVNGQPIHGTAFHSGFSLYDFTIRAAFFLTQALGYVGYQTQVTSDITRQKFFDTLDITADAVAGAVADYLGQAQALLDSHSLDVGQIFTPWLLGAEFEVQDVSFSPVNSQPLPVTSADGTPAPQGDIVIQYLGQATPATDQPVAVAPPAPTTLTITTTELGDGIVGQPYSQAFSAAGASGAVSWTVAGTPPPGVTFDAGALTGTPTDSGIYEIELTARDAAANEASRSYSFAINTVELGISTLAPLPDATIGDAYGLELSASPPTVGVWSARVSPPACRSRRGASSPGCRRVTALAPPSRYSSSHRLVSRPSRCFRSGCAIRCSSRILSTPPAGMATRSGNPRRQRVRARLVPEGTSPSRAPGDLDKVDHIVVVMMENRSFDHMLGYLSREGGRADVEGLKWEAGSDRTQFNFYKGRYYYPERLRDTHAFSTNDMSPDHSHETVKAQMADGMAHFVSDYAKTKVGDQPDMLKLVMGYYGAEELPVYDMLAREFAICDHWFCSHPGPTWPNRFVTLTGDLNRDSYGEPEVNTPISADFTPSEAPTIFDLLTGRGVSWLYFQQRASMMRVFTKYSFDMTHVLEFDRFEDTVKSESGLPSVTFVDPLFGDLPAGVNSRQDNDDAPPSDLKDGQRFISSILRTLFTPTTNTRWLKTMLVIVYDEHGGFYDHVQPPTNATPLTGQSGGMLGPRVPAFVVSPWTPPGLVLKETFDHGTIGATILRRFCSPLPPTLSPRVTAARDLRDALALVSPHESLDQRLGLDDLVPTPVGVTEPLARTAARRFRAPHAPDDYGALLGGVMMTIGSTPR